MTDRRKSVRFFRLFDRAAMKRNAGTGLSLDSSVPAYAGGVGGPVRPVDALA